jgi:hypothetical protein
MTLGTLLRDTWAIFRLKKLVGHIRSGYCYQTFELVGACRRISARIQELDINTRANLEKDCDNVVSRLAETLQETHCLQEESAEFKEAKRELIKFYKLSQLKLEVR